MDCEKTQELMSSYIDGEATDIDIAELESHIENCDNCKCEFSQLLDIVNGLKSIDKLEIPHNLHNEIINNIKYNITDSTNMLENEKNKINKFNFKRFAGKHWIVMSATTAVACLIIFIISFPLLASLSLKNSDYELSNFVQTQPKSSSMLSSDENIELNTGENNGNVNSKMLKSENVEDQILKEDLNLSPIDTYVENNTQIVIPNKKIIKTANTKIKVYNLDETISQLETIATQYGGYIENSNSHIILDDSQNIQSKLGDVTLKVPSEYYYSILDDTKALGVVMSKSEYLEDSMSSYTDTESLLKTKNLEEERLLAIMEKTENVEDLIIIEQRLSNVRSEIEMYTSKINNWNNLVEFSTIIVNLEQLEEGTSIDTTSYTLSDRMKKGFIDSINNIKVISEKLIIWSIQILPILLIIIALLAIIFIIIKIIKKLKSHNIKKS